VSKAGDASVLAHGWLSDLEHRRWRMLTAARVFTLAAALGLSTSAGSVTESATTFLALCVVAAVTSIPLPHSWLRLWTVLAEGALAALILGAAAESGAPLLVYLVVPPFAAGVEAGRTAAGVAIVAELAAVLAGLVAGSSLESTVVVAMQLAPWVLASAGVGLLGAWIRESTPQVTVEQAGYEAAHRLLEQLHAVARRLSSGLDTYSLSQHTLALFVRELDAERAVVLLRSSGAPCAPVASHGTLPFFDTAEDDASVRESWATGTPAQRRVPSGSALTRSRIAFPISVGPRLIGSLVVDRVEPVDSEHLTSLQRFLDEQALKLETAMLFDEVRTLATMEERQRLAREIHDGAAQEVASLGYLVDALSDCEGLDEVESVYQDLRRELSRIVGELRLSIFDLRSNAQVAGGLSGALAEYAREIGARSGMRVHLALSEHPRRLPAETENQLLRIAQEAISNARKHAEAANLWITLNTDTSLAELGVEDDGVGAMAEHPGHFGLAIMRERAERVGATLTLGNRPGGGSSVCVTLDRDHHHRTEGADRVHVSSAR
jgi:signal transduction histidine kinase